MDLRRWTSHKISWYLLASNLSFLVTLSSQTSQRIRILPKHLKKTQNIRIQSESQVEALLSPGIGPATFSFRATLHPAAVGPARLFGRCQRVAEASGEDEDGTCPTQHQRYSNAAWLQRRIVIRQWEKCDLASLLAQRICMDLEWLKNRECRTQFDTNSNQKTTLSNQQCRSKQLSMTWKCTYEVDGTSTVSGSITITNSESIIVMPSF